MALRLRRGTDLERQSIVFEEGELVLVTDTQQLYAGDGATPGGYLVSNIGSPPELIQNLDLNGFDISGSGTISATAFVGDGSGLTNLPISGGLVLGSDYRINIVSDDSTVLVNSETNTITGNFNGDGSNITDITLEQLDDVSVFIPQDGDVLTYSSGVWTNSPAGGIVEGSDYAINIIGQDSSLIVDTLSNTVNSELIKSSLYRSDTDLFDFVGNDLIPGEVKIRIVSNDDRASLSLIRESDLDISNDDLAYGAIYFERNDVNGQSTAAIIAGRIDGIAFTADKDGIFPESKSMKFTDLGSLGIGVYEPAEKLDVRGNGVFTGNVEAAAFKGSVVADDSTIMVDAVNNTITVGGYIQFGSYSDTEISEITPANGMVYYNTTDNKFRGYQNGIWINLDDGTTA